MVERGREDKKRLKTYKNLWDDFISDKNIKLAIKNASKKKKKRNRVKEIYYNQDEYVPIIREYVINFEHFYHEPKEIYDGISRKKRQIVIPTFMECILHHMIINVLKPMFNRGMYEHSCGSVPKRGGTHGKKYIEKWMRKGGKNIKCFFKMDIHHFYRSIPQDKLIEKLKNKIHDHRFLRVLIEVIRSVPEGLPLGFYTSVWLGNWYLNELDHAIKEKMKAVYYVRNVDDIVIFGSNKKKLHKMRKAINEILSSLGLEMKCDWQVARTVYYEDDKCRRGRALDFIGYKFFKNRTTLRKSILRKMRRKALKIWKKNKITSYDAKQMMASLGWIKSSNTYKYYLRYIKPFVDFGKLKRIISSADKRKAGLYDRVCIN